MNQKDLKDLLNVAVHAAEGAGELMRKNLAKTKKVNEASQHDIKLDLDVRCQKLIEKTLLNNYPTVAILGEEGTRGDQEADYRWVVDPIDGTVNFAYGIPHACVSIALQERLDPPVKGAREFPDLMYRTIIGVVYDPFQDELWTAVAGQPARLNGKKISVSPRARLSESIIAVGFAKELKTIELMVPTVSGLLQNCRKIRIMGSATLALCYVACGRFDAFTEYGVRLWDIVAGGFIVDQAGGEFWNRPVETDHRYHVLANNGKLRRAIEGVYESTKR